MLDVNGKAYTGHQSSIARWVYQTLGLKGVRLRTRLQGNDLHILCESTQCPSSATLVPQFIQALKTQGATSVFLTDPEHPIYQIILYGRAFESQRPEWVEAISLERLDEHESLWQGPSKEPKEEDSRGDAPVPPPQQEKMAAEESVDIPHQHDHTPTPQQESAATARSEELLVSGEPAWSEQPEAIAWYLSETLSPLGVAVKVVIQDPTASPSGAASLKGRDRLNASSTQNVVNSSGTTGSAKPAPTTQHSHKRRLWVVCNADYSPDPSLVAQAVTKRLRELNLEGFHDARILALVSGETTPDWELRVDMTPPKEMLEDWAHWGDVQAIARLLNQALANQKIQVRAVLKQTTLHLFARNIADDLRRSPKGKKDEATAPDKETVMNAIAPILESIAPQGIQAATIYGMVDRELGTRQDPGVNSSSSQSPSETPVWSEWLNLPACCFPALAETPIALAQRGDEPALVFLLQRLLNSDMDWRLATGGIRVSLRRKQDLLHIMTEAPVCPLQSQVASPIAKFIRQLQISKIAGVRVYGRRAGQSSPLWSSGVDFTSRARKAPPVEFAASADFGSDQLLNLASPDQPTNPQKTGSTLARTLQAWGRKLQAGLCATQLFIPAAQDKESHWSFAIGQDSSAFDKGQTKVALVWGCLGLLLTFQCDWLIGQMVRHAAESTESSVVMTGGQQTAAPIDVEPIPEMSLQKRGSSRSKVGRNKAATFNSSGFTRQGETSVVVTERGDGNNFVSHERVSAGAAAILAAARSKQPSFNNRMLDEKLALYQQRLQQRGGVPPEVLIVGSSRAMRGIDPTVLKTGLAAAGFGKIEVFNFGINGATSQVVDLVIRRILASSQLPKMIIWADGARAFNSARVDATYNAIANSVGYQQLNAGSFPAARTNLVPPSRSAIAAASSESLAPSESGNFLLRSSLTSSYQAVEDHLNQALSNVSSTYPQRTQLTSLILGYFAQLIPGSAQDELTSGGSDERGEAEDTNLIHLNSDIDVDGFLPLSIRFVPATYYKLHSKVSGDYDGDYDSFQMNGQQDAALNSLLQFVQDNQIQLVFVNLPLTKEYLDPVRTKYEQEFQRHMRQVAREKGLIFRDLSGLWPTKSEYFSDPSHLNQYGAYEVSNQLLQDPMIPWPTPEEKNSK